MQYGWGNMTMSNVPTYLQKEIKAIHRNFVTKQFCKSSYIVPNRLLDENCDEHAKVKIKAS
jgi:hypothetical protein